MNPHIIDIDREKYVYMMDIFEHDKVFALERTEYVKFADIYNRYANYEDALKMPETLTVLVLPLMALTENVYQLQQHIPVSYPVKRIYHTIAKGHEPITKNT